MSVMDIHRLAFCYVPDCDFASLVTCEDLSGIAVPSEVSKFGETSHGVYLFGKPLFSDSPKIKAVYVTV